MIVIVEDLTYDDVTGDIPGPANIPTHLMVKEKKIGRTEHNIKEITSLVKKMDMENSTGLILQVSKATSKTTIFMELELISGQMEENSVGIGI